MKQMKRFGAIALVLLVTVGLVAAGAGGVFALGNNSTNGTDNGTGMNMSDNGTGMNMSDNGTGMNMSDNDSDMGMSGPNATVNFEDQTSDGTTVVVDSVNMKEGGFIAIHNASLLENTSEYAVSSVIGVSDLLDNGTHNNVSVTLFDVPGGNYSENMSLTESQALIAMPHYNTNDDDVYDFVRSDGALDTPYLNDSGGAVVDAAAITVQSGDNNGGSGKAKQGDNGTTTTSNNGGGGKSKAGDNMTTTTTNDNNGGSGKAKSGDNTTTTTSDNGGSGKAKQGGDGGDGAASGGNGKAKQNA